MVWGVLDTGKLASLGGDWNSIGGSPFSFLLKTRQPNLFLCDSSSLWVSVSLPDPKVSCCKQDFVYWLLKSVPGFPTDIFEVSLWQIEFSLIFTARCYLGSSSWHYCSRLGSPEWGWNLTLLSVGPLWLRYPSDFSTACVDVGPTLFPSALFPSLPFLLVLRWIVLYIFAYKTYCQMFIANLICLSVSFEFISSLTLLVI